MNQDRRKPGMQLLAAGLAAGLLATPLAARAEAMASAVMALEIRLVDDDPFDAVTPWISFANGIDSRLSLVGWPGTAGPEAVQLGGSGPFGAVSGTLGRPSYALSGSLDGQGSATSPYRLATDALARGGGAAFETLVSVPSDHGSFLLSAHTTLIVTAQVSLQTSVSGGDGEEQASAHAYLMLAGPGGRVEDSEQRTALSPDLGGGQFGASSASFARQFSLSLSNTGAVDQTGQFYAVVDTLGHSAVSAVPEPAACALMLAGLGLLAVRRRSTAR